MDIKKIIKKLLFVHPVIVLLLAIISGVGLAFVFIKGLDTSPIAYVVYVVSFYSLTVLCLACWKTFPKYYKNAKGKVYGNKYANRYLTDKAFQTRVNLYRSLLINLIYVAINAVSAVIYSTAWFAIFAIYYAIMAIMRFLLVRFAGKNGLGENVLGEHKRSRICACILMTVNLLLSGAVLMMVYFDRGFEYEGMLIYVMAAYTFYITTMSIIDIVKYRKHASPIIATSTVIRLASALFSMLFLETAMLAQFGAETSAEFESTMIMATGGGISVIVVLMALNVIIHSTKEIKKLKINNSKT